MSRPLVFAVLLLFASGPVAAQEVAWTYVAAPDSVELTYGPPGGGVAALSLTCVKDSRQLVARFPVAQRLGVNTAGGRWLDDVGRPAPWPVSVTLASVEAQTTIPGLADIDPEGGGSIVSVEFADRAPVAEAFRRTGEIRVTALGGGVTPSPAPRRSVQTFLRYCR